MIQYYSKNGNIVLKEEALLGASDLAVLRGYGVFDFLLVKHGIPLYFEEHLRRFFHSAASLNLKIPFSKTEILKQVQALNQLNHLDDSAIKLLLTGGYSKDGYTLDNPNFFILQSPISKYPASDYTEGLKLLLYNHERSFPSVKSTSYLVGIFAETQAMSKGARGALFHNDGWIRETPFSNFFIVGKDDKIITAKEGVLMGITRKHVIEVSKQYYALEERALHIDELRTAKEAFITSTSKKIVPIVQVNDIIIGDGKPGMTRKHLFELISKKEEDYLITNNQLLHGKGSPCRTFT